MFQDSEDLASCPQDEDAVHGLRSIMGKESAEGTCYWRMIDCAIQC